MDGVLAAHDYPAAVQLEADLCRIGMLQELVVGQDAINRSEFGIVIVIGELHARSLDLCGYLVELVCAPAPVIESERAFGPFLLMHGGRTDYISDAQGFTEGQDLI